MFASRLEPDQWYLKTSLELCADSIPGRTVEYARAFDIKGLIMCEYAASLKARRAGATGTDDGATSWRQVPFCRTSVLTKCTTHFAPSSWISASQTWSIRHAPVKR